MYRTFASVPQSVETENCRQRTWLYIASRAIGQRLQFTCNGAKVFGFCAGIAGKIQFGHLGL